MISRRGMMGITEWRKLSREAALARTLVDLADNLVDDFDVVEVLTLLTRGCIDVLGVDAAGIMLVAPGGDLRVMASSSETMRILELFEIQSEEGPCLDCFHGGQALLNYGLDADGLRWPTFTPEALGAGFRSVGAIPMRLRGKVIGALNVFHRSGEMSEADADAARALADIATIAILQHQAVVEAGLVNERLQSALSSRVIIEQAKGMVGERSGMSMEAAFSALRKHARDRNLNLADVARDVVDGRVTFGHPDDFTT
jgi:GAF domain-containing protein